MAPKLAAQHPDPRVKKVGDAVKKVYLVTFPHPRLATRVRQGNKAQTARRYWAIKSRINSKTAAAAVPRDALKAPEEFDRTGIQQAVLDAAAAPIYDRSSHHHYEGNVVIEQMAVFMELHKESLGEGRKIHFHVAIQAGRSFRFAPLKRALRVRHGLATHWSCEHDGYFSAVRYGAMPTPKKPQAELDPSPKLWARVGSHKPLFEACQEPATMGAIRSRRENAAKKASEAGKPAPRPTQMDLYAAIVSAGIRNSPDDQHAAAKLIDHLKRTSQDLYAYAFKIRAQLPAFINDVWMWETVGDTLPLLAMTRMQRLEQAAEQPCVCAGMWRHQAERVIQANAIDPAALFTSVCCSLFQGRGPATKVVVLAGKRGGEGKSFLLGPLRVIYGAEYVQESPQPGNFPLLGLESKTIALLDEWRFDQNVLLIGTQFLWLEGKPLPIPKPQNQAGASGHIMYRGTAPIFITTPADALEKMQQMAAWAAQTNQSSEVTMLLRRLQVFWLQVPTPVPAGITIPDCAHCFARMALQWSRDRRGLTTGVAPALPRDMMARGPALHADGIDMDDL